MFNLGDKIGLIGVNGVGKFSLFVMLCGELYVDQGNVDFLVCWCMVYVVQEMLVLDCFVIEYVIDGDVYLCQLEVDLVCVEVQLDDKYDGNYIVELYIVLVDVDVYIVCLCVE